MVKLAAFSDETTCTVHTTLTTVDTGNSATETAQDQHKHNISRDPAI